MQKEIMNGIRIKLMKIQADLKAPKGQYNNFGKYKYRSCEDILEALKPLCSKEGTILTISDEIVLVADRIYVKATATLSNAEAGDEDNISVSAYAREASQKKGMDESQITGAASSYARKYALNGLFAIDDTKDADTKDNTENNKKPNRSEPAALRGVTTAQGELTEEQKKLLATLSAFCNGERAKMKKELKERTSFKVTKGSEKGKVVPGKDSIFKIKDAQARVVRHQLENEMKKKESEKSNFNYSEKCQVCWTFDDCMNKSVETAAELCQRNLEIPEESTDEEAF